MARQEVFLFLTGLVQQFNILPPERSDTIECTEEMELIYGRHHLKSVLCREMKSLHNNHSGDGGFRSFHCLSIEANECSS